MKTALKMGKGEVVARASLIKGARYGLWVVFKVMFIWIFLVIIVIHKSCRGFGKIPLCGSL